MPRPKQRTQDLRARAVAAALDVLAQDGVAGLTTRTVANRSDASVPAIYEVFGDKGGLIRAVFFEGFRMLSEELETVRKTAEPIESLIVACETFRAFVLAHPELAQTMFSRPFVDFAPSEADNKAGLSVSRVFVQYAKAAVEAGELQGDPTDIAHLFFAFAEGLASAESANRLGGSRQSANRRWNLGLDTLIKGLRPE